MKLMPIFMSFSVLFISGLVHAQDVSFYEKFNRKPDNKVGYAFKAGEVVSGQFRVTSEARKNGNIDSTKISLTFDDGKIDSTAADTFHVKVTPEQFTYFRNLIGLRLNGKVKITGLPKEALTGMVMDDSFNYPAEVVDSDFSPVPSAFNPTAQQIQTLPAGTPVRVEGTVLSATKDLVRVSASDSSIIDIHLYELEMPQIADVSTPDFEIFNYQDVTPGEKVRVLAGVNKDDQTQAAQLVTDWCYRFYLLGLNSKLQAQLDRGNHFIDLKIASMQKYLSMHDYHGARIFYGDLANGRLNSLQRSKINSIRISMPESERPLDTLNGDARFTADEVNKDFKANVDGMTQGEYTQLMKKVASRAVPAPYEADYMFRLAEDVKLPKPIIFSTAKLVLDSYLPYFTKMAAAGSPRPPMSDWDSEYLLSESIMYYAEAVSTVAEAETLLKDVTYLNALNNTYVAPDGRGGMIQDIFMMSNFREVLEVRESELSKQGHADVAAILGEIRPNWYPF